MGRLRRRAFALAVCVIAIYPLACATHPRAAHPSPAAPIIRVRLISGQDRIILRATASPTAYSPGDPHGTRLNFPRDTDIALTPELDGWRLGDSFLPGPDHALRLVPAGDGTLAINGRRYHGAYRIRLGPDGKLEVINEVDVDSYLKSVVSRELLHDWNIETYKAQAIIARTYAIYQTKTAGATRAWDLNDDIRSQVYGGIDDESSRSIDAVDDTSGIVAVYGPSGREKIFKTYFSACCGGISLSAADAFNEPYLLPLSDQDARSMCAASKWFNWGPVEISRQELTRRFRLWGARRHRPEQAIDTIDRIEIQFVNRFNRPTRFLVTDVGGGRYSLMSEELRNAVNIDATSQTKLFSSFVKVVNDPASDVIRFVEGHGNGHGVGMCQYCSEARAEAGMRHEDIVLSAYPHARLARAY
jgi:stage II sporulation protein D